MIKLEICKCINPYNRFFEEGKLYVLHTSKGNQGMTAYVDKDKAFSIVSPKLVSTSVAYYKMYFETIESVFLKNYKEINELKKKTPEEILETIRKEINERSSAPNIRFRDMHEYCVKVGKEPLELTEEEMDQFRF